MRSRSNASDHRLIASPQADARSPAEQIRFAQEIMRSEAAAIVAISDRLGDDFCHAVEQLFQCQGSVLVAGIGKAGLVGQKIVATLSSTGTRSHFLHPAEAMHGDLGRIHRDDCLLILSFSGETEEVLRILPSLLDFGTPIVAVTGNRASTLARSAAVTLDLGPIREACSLGLAPSSSTTAMLALGDAVALVMSRMRQFGPLDFARFHPGGSLGRRLTKVDQVMRPLSECRVASDELLVKQVFAAVQRPGRRTGAIMLVDQQGKLAGIFTDSDLARLLEAGRQAALDGPVREVMTPAPKCVVTGDSLSDAWDVLAGRKISELPVVDASGFPIGMIDITDVLGLNPPMSAASRRSGNPTKTTILAERVPTLIPFPR